MEKYIRQANDEDLEHLKKDCDRMDGFMAGFDYINFVDYRPILNEVVELYPNLDFKQKDYGISVNYRTEI